MSYLLARASQRPLPRAEQIEIARRWVDGGRTDRSLRDLLIVTNLRLVLRFAAAYCPSTQGQDVREDLIQAAVVAMLAGLQRYDPAHEIAVSTYLGFWARAAMSRWLLHNRSIVRWARTARLQKLDRGLWRAEGRHLAQDGEADEARIAQEFGVTVDELRAARAVMRAPLSFDRPVGRTDPAPLGDRLDSGAPSPEEQVAEAEVLVWLHQALGAARMTPRQRKVVEARLAGESLEEAGRRIGVTRERARQIELQAMRPLLRSLQAQATKGTR